MKEMKIHIVPHAHWDKEWYFTKQDSDLLLKGNLDKLNEIIKNNTNFRSFTYDGQSSIIDDYKILNGNDEELQKNIKSKKIILGPWYSQPDLFNTSSEAIVRNLLVGINMAEKAGNSMKIAYVPDSFGQSSQMPQIYKLFKLENMIYWRGITKEKMQNSVLHFWEGLDGTKIKSYNFLFGYWIMGSFFPYLELNKSNAKKYAETFLSNFAETLNDLIKFNPFSKNNLLLPLGGDQAPVNEFIDIFLDELNKIDKKHDWVWSDYESYFEEIENVVEIPNFKGELRSPESSRIHKTIGSQRADIKQLAKKVDNLLFEKLEPLSVYFNFLGGKYPFDIIEKILKNCLTSHAHDSLGGCNTDETNKDVVSRLNWSEQWIEAQITKTFKALMKNDENDSILVFNPNPQKTCSDLELVLFTKFKNFDVFENDFKLKNIVLDSEFIKPNLEINNGTNGESADAIDGYWKFKIILKDLNFDGIQIKKLNIKKAEHNNYLVLNKKELNIWENEKWQIKINTKGSFNLFDKQRSKWFKNLLSFEAQRDAGDSYDFSPETIENKLINKIINTKWEIKESENIAYVTIENNYSIKNGNEQKIISILKISESNQIDFNIKIDNKNKDIKWRVNFNSEILNSDYSYANQAFGIEKRLTKLPENDFWQEKNWNEKPVEIETNESFVYLKDTDYKFGLITKGNNEYQIIGDKLQIISLTLFRSVSYLGKNNLLWRPGRASGTSDFLIKTNDSKLQKELEFEFSLFVVNSDESIWNLAQTEMAKPFYFQKQNLNLYEKRFERFLIADLEEVEKLNFDCLLSVKNKNLVVKSIKKSESNKHIILRIFNTSDSEQKLTLTGKWNIVGEVNLLERDEKKPQFVFKPYEIKTYVLK